MRYPEFLKENGTIGFVAPSFGCTREPYASMFDNALKLFRGLGFETLEGPNCRAEAGIGISNLPEKCGAELNDMYASPDSVILISCGGGEMMCSVIPYMDFERIKKATPKWYMGYSDNTNFTFLSTTIADTAAVYGPCAAYFGMEPLDESLFDALELLKGNKLSFTNYPKWEKLQLRDPENPLLGYNLTEPACVSSAFGDKAQFSGRLIGGCIDCLNHIHGTPYDKVSEFLEKYKEDGFIWFLEACDLNVMSVRRSIWQMKEAGWFKYVKGFLFGRPRLFDDEGFGLNMNTAVTDLLAEYGVPVIMNLDIGHLPPQMPVISGAIAKVNFENSRFEIEYVLK